MNPKKPLLELEHISKSYPAPGGQVLPVLKDVSLAVGPGRYWIVADTFVDGQGTPLAGPYELRIRLD